MMVTAVRTDEYYNATDPSNSKVSQKWITQLRILMAIIGKLKMEMTGSGAMLWQTQSVNERGQVPLLCKVVIVLGARDRVYNATGFQTNVNYKKNPNVFLDLGTDF